MTEKRNLQIFIVGMARSGTTLLSEILNSHSQIAVTHETHYFRKYWEKPELSSQENRKRLLLSFLNSKEFLQFDFSEKLNDVIYQEALRKLDNGQSEFLGIVLDKFIIKKNKLYWCEKTPSHLLHVPEISQLFPGSKFICLIRDPRDVCLSLKKVPFNAGFSAKLLPSIY